MMPVESRLVGRTCTISNTPAYVLVTNEGHTVSQLSGHDANQHRRRHVQVVLHALQLVHRRLCDVVEQGVTVSHYGPGLDNHKDFSSWVRQQSQNSDPVLLTLDLLNPKSTGFDRVSRTTTLCQVSSHSDQGFSFYRANIPTYPHIFSPCRVDGVVNVTR